MRFLLGCIVAAIVLAFVKPKTKYPLLWKLEKSKTNGIDGKPIFREALSNDRADNIVLCESSTHFFLQTDLWILFVSGISLSLHLLKEGSSKHTKRQ